MKNSSLIRAFLLAFGVWLFYGMMIGSNDLRSYTLQHAGVEALVERHTFDVSGSSAPQLKNPGDTFWHRERLLAAKQPGQFVFGAIPYSFFYQIGLSYQSNYDLVAALVTWCSAGLAVASATFALYLLLSIGWSFSIGASFYASIGYALATTMLAYAGVPHHDVIAAAFIVWAFTLFEIAASNNSLYSPYWRFFGGVCSGLALFTSFLAAPVIGTLTIYVLSRQLWISDLLASRLLRCGQILAGMLIGLAPLFLYNFYYFENPFLQANIAGNYQDTIFNPEIARFWRHLQTYIGFGEISIWKYSPIAGLGFIGILFFPKRLQAQQLFIIVALILHLGYILNIETIGHCQYGPRYLIPTQAIVILGLAQLWSLAQNIAPGRWLLIILLIISSAINAGGALGGTMYCSLPEHAFIKYFENLSQLANIEFPLRKYCTFALLLFAGYVGMRRTPGKDWPPALALDRFGVQSQIAKWFPLTLAILIAFAYFVLCKEMRSPYDYTFRVAMALLDGTPCLTTHPGGWLNELVPWEGCFYSAFPLGSVLSLVPYALLVKFGIVSGYYSILIVVLLGFFGSLLSYFLARHFFPRSCSRPLLIALLFSFGTWHFVNLLSSGAWQIAIGIAVVAQIASLYFLLVHRLPILAGFFFAVAFGNRTEILLTAPVMFWLLLRDLSFYNNQAVRKEAIFRVVFFSIFPLILGIATLYYNWVRFGSIIDFGYAHIPGVLQEPWYRDGIFSISAIPGNIDEMLLKTWRLIPNFPYLVPSGFGGSVLISCPALLLLMNKGEQRDRTLRLVAWAMMVFLLAVLWTHGNPGGWQYSYRYGAVLLPWIIIAILQGLPAEHVTKQEVFLIAISLAINLYANYLFNWTSYVQP